MSEAWKQIKLEGGGLQDVNLRMARLQKTRGMAYGLWLLFPLGAHRIYLGAPLSSLLYVVLTALSIILWLTVGPLAWISAAAEAAWAVFDLFWIDRRVTAINKALRVDLFMAAGAKPPPGYRGRYGEDVEELIADYAQIKERERSGHVKEAPREPHFQRGKRIPSIAEQEAMLRDMRKRGKDDD